MRMILPLLLAGCLPPSTDPVAPVDTGSEPGDTSETAFDTGDTSWEDGTLPPPPIDLATPAHVELATFALG